MRNWLPTKLQKWPEFSSFSINANLRTLHMLYFSDPPPPFNAATPARPSAPTTNTCDPCSSFAPLINCIQSNQQKKRNCTSYCNACAQLFILTISTLTFLLVLMIILASPNMYQNGVKNGLKGPKTSENEWMPNNFQTWTSEKLELKNHSIVIEGKKILDFFCSILFIFSHRRIAMLDGWWRNLPSISNKKCFRRSSWTLYIGSVSDVHRCSRQIWQFCRRYFRIW